MARAIQNAPELPVIWDYLTEAGYRVHVDAPNCVFLYVQWRSANQPAPHTTLILRVDDTSYSISPCSCVELTKLLRYPLVVQLAKQMIRNHAALILSDENNFDYPYIMQLKIKNPNLWQD